MQITEENIVQQLKVKNEEALPYLVETLEVCSMRLLDDIFREIKQILRNACQMSWSPSGFTLIRLIRQKTNSGNGRQHCEIPCD